MRLVRHSSAFPVLFVRVSVASPLLLLLVVSSQFSFRAVTLHLFLSWFLYDFGYCYAWGYPKRNSYRLAIPV